MTLTQANGETIKTGFPPVANIDARTLVLGSMPGEASLQKKQYYGHPRNLFWEFMGEILGFNPNIAYDERLLRLTENQIALWDVLNSCQRNGSLDANIIETSEVINDFDRFFDKYRQINRICFNGQKAFNTFKKYAVKRQKIRYSAIEKLVLPSTSPANASIPRDIKYRKWKEAITG